MLYAVAASVIDSGTGLVLESNFRRGVSDAELRPLVNRSRAVFVHCTVPDIERRRRCAERIRHPGHFDAALLAAWDPEITVFGPPALDDLTIIEADGAARLTDALSRLVPRLRG